MSYPKRECGPDGRMMTELRAADALATVGGQALEFVLEPETWPVFFAWLCVKIPEFCQSGSLAVHDDVQRVLDLLPPPVDAS